MYNNGTHDFCPYLCSHVDKIIEAVAAPPEAEMFSAIQLAPGCER